jgi:hypothetical protein
VITEKLGADYCYRRVFSLYLWNGKLQFHVLHVGVKLGLCHIHLLFRLCCTAVSVSRLYKVKLSPCLTNWALRHEGVWGSGCIDSIASDVGIIDQWGIGKYLEGSSRDLIEILCWHLSGGTEEAHDQCKSWQRVSRPRFEPNTSRM